MTTEYNIWNIMLGFITETNPITVIIAIMAAIAVGTFVAAMGAHNAARATQKATEAQLFSMMMEEYASFKMFESLRTLRKLRKELPREGEQSAGKSAIPDIPLRDKQDVARRYVKYYFLKALRLKERGFLSEELLEQLCNVEGIKVLFDVVEPLECSISESYDSSEFKTLRKYYDNFNKRR